jgi:hypothetical protein
MERTDFALNLFSLENRNLLAGFTEFQGICFAHGDKYFDFSGRVQRGLQCTKVTQIFAKEI